jgi:monovalent cation:H+ antiporter-2, CPA2 family
MFMNAVITVAIFLIISIYGQPKITELLPNQNNGPLISLFASFLISAPFIWAISLGDTGHNYESLIWKNRTHRVLLFVLQIIRLVLTFFLLTALSARFVGFANFLIYSLIIVLIGIAVMSRYIAEIYHWFEFKFVNNLSLNKNDETPAYPALAPWDSHLIEVKLSADSSLIGQTLLNAELREKYGIIITLIKRGSRIILAPDRNEILYPSDLLQIIGSDEQIIKFKQACEITTKHDNNESIPEHSLYSVYVNKDHYFIDRTIKQSELRERAGALVVGIEKSGERILNPSSDTIIKDGDTLWLVLPKTNISKILET